MTSAPPAAPPSRDPTHLVIEIAPVALLVGLLLWTTRAVLSPLVITALLFVVLWPQRNVRIVMRLLIAAALLTGIWFLYSTGALLAPFVLAAAIAYLLAPMVAMLERRSVPRGVGSLLVLLPFLGLLVGLGLILFPAIESQFTELANRLPDFLRRLAEWLLGLRNRLLASSIGLLSESQAAWLRDLEPSDLVAIVQERWEAIGRSAWNALLGIGRGFNVALTVLGYLVVTPVVTYYLLKAWPRITERARDLVPPASSAELFAFLDEFDDSLGRYARGQLTEATFVAILTGGLLALLGFPGALLVGVIAGLGNLIPYVGLPISLIPGVLFALVSGAVLPSLIKLGAVFFVVQFIDGSITGPRIVGRSVGLDPVWVMIALALFGTLLGFVGLLVAVPLAVLVKMLAVRAVRRYKESPLYLEPASVNGRGGP